MWVPGHCHPHDRLADLRSEVIRLRPDWQDTSKEEREKGLDNKPESLRTGSWGWGATRDLTDGNIWKGIYCVWVEADKERKYANTQAGAPWREQHGCDEK